MGRACQVLVRWTQSGDTYECTRFSLLSLMVTIGLIAVSFATLGVIPGSIVATAVLTYRLINSTSRWTAAEITATVAWLLGAALLLSNVALDGIKVFFFFVAGGVLGLSWLLREYHRGAKSRSNTEWGATIFVPASGLLALVLAITDLDFDLRLAMSESALRADASLVSTGRSNLGKSRWVGLFYVEHVEQQGKCTLWTTGNDFIDSVGVAYCPGVVPVSARETTPFGI